MTERIRLRYAVWEFSTHLAVLSPSSIRENPEIRRAMTFALDCRPASPRLRPARATILMVKKDFTILNKLGIHARPAAQFVKIANRFQAEIYVEKDGEEIDGKSIMGLMMLAAGFGSVVTISADGPDENTAIDAIGDLIGRKFEET